MAKAQLNDRSTFDDGRYKVKKLIGEGGKKRVYLAHDDILDRDVAIAIIKTEGLEEASRSRITREAQALGRLGVCPRIRSWRRKPPRNNLLTVIWTLSWSN